eukprot:2353313-Amphidinium_carterae.1
MSVQAWDMRPHLTVPGLMAGGCSDNRLVIQPCSSIWAISTKDHACSVKLSRSWDSIPHIMRNSTQRSMKQCSLPRTRD